MQEKMHTLRNIVYYICKFDMRSKGNEDKGVPAGVHMKNEIN